MKQIIQNLISYNPYRILAVYVGDPIAKEVSHRSRICAYSKVGQTVEFSLKGDEKLPALVRKEEMANQAVQELSLSASRLKYSLFWYADEKYKWASLINNAVDSLLSEDLSSALAYYEYLLHDDTLRNDFIETVTNGIGGLNKEKLVDVLAETIFHHLESEETILNCQFLNNTRELGVVFFERWFREKLDELAGEYVRNDSDFYVMIDNLKTITDQITTYIKFAASVYGIRDYRYKECAEGVVRIIYEQGKNILYRISYWMNDKRSLSSVKICRSLAGDVFNYIDEVIGRFELEADSYGVIGTSPNAFKEEYYSRLEYFELFSKKIKRKNDLMTWLWLMGITIILHLLN